jgi:hypothetical protein
MTLPQQLQYRTCLKPKGTINTKPLQVVHIDRFSLVVVEGIFMTNNAQMTNIKRISDWAIDSSTSVYLSSQSREVR